MHKLIFTAFVFFSYIIVVDSQNLFSRYVDLKVGLADNPKDFLIKGDTVFIASVQVCDQPTSDMNAQFCTSLTMFNLNGEMLDSIIIREATVGNEKIMISNGSNKISMIGALSDSEQFVKSPPRVINVLIEDNKLTLDTIIALEFDTTLIDLNFNEGFLMVDSTYVSYGTGRVNGEAFVCGFIHEWNSNTSELIETNIIKTGDAENQIFDLQFNQEGNLEYINQIEDLSGSRRQTFVITEFDKNNNSISEYRSKEFKHNSTRPNLTQLKNGDLIITTSNCEILASEDVVCIDKITKEEKWRTPILIPFTNPTEVIDIDNIYILKSNEILCIGQRRVADEFGLPISGFMYKLSEHGEIIWKRTYKKLDLEGEYITSRLTKVVELDDGSLFAIGNARDFSETGELKRMLWILKTDSFGCLDESCGESILLSSEDNRIDEISVSPNPFNNVIKIEEITNSTNVKVFDVSGKEVYQKSIKNKASLILDLSNLFPGLYYLTLFNRNQLIGTKTIIKTN